MSYEVQWQGYEDGKRVLKKHGIFDTLEEAQDSVREWWKKNDFEPYYIRQWKVENRVIWDYGSHTCFYYFVTVGDSNDK